MIEALARKIVLDALDGRASAQKLVLARLDEEAAGEAGESRDAAAEECADEAGEESQEPGEDSEEEDEEGEEERFVFDRDGTARELLGARYGALKARIERAVDACDLDGLADVMAEIDLPEKFPAAGNFTGNSEKKGEAAASKNELRKRRKPRGGMR